MVAELLVEPLQQRDTDNHTPITGVRVVDRCLVVSVSLLTLVCLALHLVLVIAAPALSTVAMVLVAAACFGCALHGLRHTNVAMWAWMVVSSLAMLSLHVFSHPSAHAHGTGAISTAPDLDNTLMTLTMGLTGTELSIGLVALTIAGVRMRRTVSLLHTS